MEETDANTTMKAIKIFKDRHGIKAPLTTEGMDKIIVELKQLARAKPQHKVAKKKK